LIADFLIPVGAEEDEMGVQEILEFRIGVKLLTQQSAAPSAAGVEIDEDELVLGLGFGHGLVQRAVEPALGRSGGSEDKDH
jgi:hypothetical protein